jgi:hypothetical protein
MVPFLLLTAIVACGPSPPADCTAVAAFADADAVVAVEPAWDGDPARSDTDILFSLQSEQTSPSEPPNGVSVVWAFGVCAAAVVPAGGYWVSVAMPDEDDALDPWPPCGDYGSCASCQEGLDVTVETGETHRVTPTLDCP